MPTRLTVHVQPKAKADDAELQADGSLRVRVTAAPEDGKATRAVLDLLAARLGVPKRDVALLSGDRSRTKVVEVALEQAELLKRFATG